MRQQLNWVLKRKLLQDVLEEKVLKKPKFQIQKNRDDGQKGRQYTGMWIAEMIDMDKISVSTLQKRGDKEYYEKPLRSGVGDTEGVWFTLSVGWLQRLRSMSQPQGARADEAVDLGESSRISNGFEGRAACSRPSKHSIAAMSNTTLGVIDSLRSRRKIIQNAEVG